MYRNERENRHAIELRSGSDLSDHEYSPEAILQEQLDQIEELDVSTLSQKERLKAPIIPDTIDEP